MDAVEWLEKRAPGFRAVPEEQRNAMFQFLLLWSLFEAQALGRHGNVGAIRGAVENWAGKGLLKRGLFRDELAYFRERYLTNDGLTDYYFGLGIKNGADKATVEGVLRSTVDGIVDETVALLIIVYRFGTICFMARSGPTTFRGRTIIS